MSENSPPEIQGLDKPLVESAPRVNQELRSSSGAVFVPRLLRLRDAPRYLGMDKNRFNREVRCYISEIRIGVQGVAFDRLELDAWADEYKSRNGRPAAHFERSKSWDNVKGPDSHAEVGSGISTSKSEESEFAKALERVTSSKRKNNWQSG
jgi:hypothetical protein